MSEKKNQGKNEYFIKETASDKLFTYSDYLKWTDGNRYEIIGGKVHMMSPGASTGHQKVLTELLRQISIYLFQKDCDVYPAPFDVRFPEGEDKDEDVLTVVQPDISIICDKSRLDNKGYRGAPELIIEILSPSTADRDRKDKLKLYEKHGVKEYWLVDYQEKTVEVYLFDIKIKRYRESVLYTEEDMVPVNIFSDLEVNLSYVFRD